MTIHDILEGRDGELAEGREGGRLGPAGRKKCKCKLGWSPDPSETSTLLGAYSQTDFCSTQREKRERDKDIRELGTRCCWGKGRGSVGPLCWIVLVALRSWAEFDSRASGIRTRSSRTTGSLYCLPAPLATLLFWQREGRESDVYPVVLLHSQVEGGKAGALCKLCMKDDEACETETACPLPLRKFHRPSLSL